jgi:uncharacterized membrane protein
MATKRNNQFAIALRLFMATVVVILGVLLGARRAAHAASFSFTTIDVPFADADDITDCGDINSNGQIVGVYINTSGVLHAFLDEHGAFTVIDFPGAVVTVPTRINPNGQIVGFYVDSSGVEHGYLDDDGVFSTIDVPGATLTASQLIAINSSGQIVGTYFDSSGGNHGFLDDKGVFTTIDVPFTGATFAGSVNGIQVGGLNAINASGQIAGTYFDSSGVAHGFLDDDGVFSTIDVPLSPYYWGTTHVVSLMAFTVTPAVDSMVFLRPPKAIGPQ